MRLARADLIKIALIGSQVGEFLKDVQRGFV